MSSTYREQRAKLELIEDKERVDRVERKLDVISERSIRTEEKLEASSIRVDEKLDAITSLLNKHVEVDSKRLDNVEKWVHAKDALKAARVANFKKACLVLGTGSAVVGLLLKFFGM